VTTKSIAFILKTKYWVTYIVTGFHSMNIM